ncbi:crossover junction endodeoxyribonuclease RuvC [Candidatus Babeliales bacterium]|nr:crossover junction endodeoxyribonuclease RuvC [Candidatus Babeliales bacterium]
MVVLGVDPSYTATGYSVIIKQGSKQQLIVYGFIPLPTTKTMQERIGMFYDFFNEMIRTYSVTHIVLETPFLGKNAQTFLKLGYLRGALYLLAHHNKKIILEFSPREVKAAVTGFGGAQKDQVARMVYMLFPGLKIQKSHDITDAIAVGLCGIWYNPALHGA